MTNKDSRVLKVRRHSISGISSPRVYQGPGSQRKMRLMTHRKHRRRKYQPDQVFVGSLLLKSTARHITV